MKYILLVFNKKSKIFIKVIIPNKFNIFLMKINYICNTITQYEKLSKNYIIFW